MVIAIMIIMIIIVTTNSKARINNECLIELT